MKLVLGQRHRSQIIIALYECETHIMIFRDGTPCQNEIWFSCLFQINLMEISKYPATQMWKSYWIRSLDKTEFKGNIDLWISCIHGFLSCLLNDACRIGVLSPYKNYISIFVISCHFLCPIVILTRPHLVSHICSVDICWRQTVGVAGDVIMFHILVQYKDVVLQL